MTDQTPDLPDLDATASRAAAGLRHHIGQHLDVERGLATLPTAPRSPAGRSRLVAVAAVVLLLVGLVATVQQRDGDGRSRLDVDEDGNPLPEPQPGVLTPLGPRDGQDSIGLPITIDPVDGLVDGTAVTVTGEGFVPGERVGIVQCAREAGAEEPEARGGGIDGCSLSSVQYADADEAGVAVGRFTVRRVLTTPLTGTVDCATEAERCIVAMGALDDYDRSGGVGFAIAGGEPIDIPELTVRPAEGLADGDVVHVTGSGFRSVDGQILDASLCSSDPSTCWSLSAVGSPYGLPVDPEGEVDADLTVYRFLPGPTPGSYIDCAISRCSLRVSGETSPPPVHLEFTPTDEIPTPPAVAVHPSSGLAEGDRVVVRGAGFNPGDRFSVSLCAAPAGSEDVRQMCTGGEGSGDRVGDDGTFAIEWPLPGFGDGHEGFAVATTVACAGGPCDEPLPPGDLGEITCDGVRWDCAIVVEAYTEQGPARPAFLPAPVPITYR